MTTQEEKSISNNVWRVLPFTCSSAMGGIAYLVSFFFPNALEVGKTCLVFCVGFLLTCFSIDRWGLKRTILWVYILLVTFSAIAVTLGLCHYDKLGFSDYDGFQFFASDGRALSRFNVVLAHLFLGAGFAYSLGCLQAFSGLPSRLRSLSFFWPRVVGSLAAWLCAACAGIIFVAWSKRTQTPQLMHVFYGVIALTAFIWVAWGWAMKRFLPELPKAPCKTSVLDTFCVLVKQRNIWLPTFILGFAGTYAFSVKPASEAFTVISVAYLLGTLSAWVSLRFFSDKVDPATYYTQNKKSAVIWQIVLFLTAALSYYLKEIIFYGLPDRWGNIDILNILSILTVMHFVIILIIAKAVFHCSRLYCATLIQVYDINPDRPALMCGLWWASLMVLFIFFQKSALLVLSMKCINRFIDGILGY